MSTDDQTTNNEQGQGGEINPDDLDLLDTGLEDEGRDESELWAEIDSEESAASGAGDSPGDEPGDDHSADDAAGLGDDEGTPPEGEGTGSDDAPPRSERSDGEPSEQRDRQAITTDDNLWKTASPEQRAAFEAAQQRLKKLEHADRSNRGRVSNLQRQLNELVQSSGRGPSTADKSGSGGEAASDQADSFLASEEWTKFADDYPEVAGPMGKVIQGMQSELQSHNRVLSALGEAGVHESTLQQVQLLEEYHEDWRDVVQDEGFVPWLEAQPRHIREAAMRNSEDIVDAEEAGDVVARYKSHLTDQGGGSQGTNNGGASSGAGAAKETTGKPSGKRTRQLDSAHSTRTRGPGVASGIPEEGDPEQIWKQFDEQEKRSARG